MIKTKCPHCRREWTVPESAEGYRISCPCGAEGKVLDGCFVQLKRGKPVIAKGKRKG